MNLENSNKPLEILAIGNGESRRGIDINILKGIKIGCNAIHRDFDVDHLICVDRRTVKEALENPNCRKIYTRPDWMPLFKDPRVSVVPPLPYQGTERPDDPFQWGSGPYAVLLAAMLSDTVKLLGFDLYGLQGKVNNVYKDTANYDHAEKRAVDPRYWIYQIYKVFLAFPDKYFIVYNVDGWQPPESWHLANVEIKTLDKLLIT